MDSQLHNPPRESEPDSSSTSPKQDSTSPKGIEIEADMSQSVEVLVGDGVETSQNLRVQESQEVSSPSDRPIFEVGDLNPTQDKKTTEEKNWLETFIQKFSEYLDRLSDSESGKVEIPTKAGISRKWEYLELKSRLQFFKETLLPQFEDSDEFYKAVESQVDFLLGKIHDPDFVGHLEKLKKLVGSPERDDWSESSEGKQRQESDVEIEFDDDSFSIDINNPISIRVANKSDSEKFKEFSSLLNLMKLFAASASAMKVPSQTSQSPKKEG
jgi:hypothetical protein